MNRPYLPEVNELVEALKDVETLKNKVILQHSAIEKEVNNLYHVLELSNLNAVQLSKVASKLRKALQVRRVVKESMSIMQSVDALTGTAIQDAIKRSQKRLKEYEQQSTKAFQEVLGVSKCEQ